MKFGPANDFLGLASVAHLGGHDAAGAGLERTHHRGVVGRRQAHESVHGAGPRRPRGVFELPDSQRAVLLVEPDRVVTAVQGDHFEHLRAAKLAEAKDANKLPLAQALFKPHAHHHSMVGEGRVGPWSYLA